MNLLDIICYNIVALICIMFEVGRANSSCFMCAIVACMRLPFFKIFWSFVHFCQYFQIFCPFLPFFWKIAPMPLLSRIGPGRSDLNSSMNKNFLQLLKLFLKAYNKFWILKKDHFVYWYYISISVSFTLFYTGRFWSFCFCKGCKMWFIYILFHIKSRKSFTGKSFSFFFKHLPLILSGVWRYIFDVVFNFLIFSNYWIQTDLNIWNWNGTLNATLNKTLAQHGSLNICYIPHIVEIH